VRTTELATGDPLLRLLPDDDPVTWLRRDEGLIGWGVASRIRTRGLTRFSDADKWWTETCARAEVYDAVNEPGSGLVCFGSFSFADEPGESVLTVPRVVVGRRGGRTWLTQVDDASYDGPADDPAPPQEIVFTDGAMDGEHWLAVVAEAIRRIGSGALEKVVLARDLIATAAGSIDIRWPLSRLAESYPMCWTFHVDGLFGATPEMLVRRERGLVTSRVLAGTIRRTGDDARDLALAATLARSSKDLEEHEYAVRSVADALEPHCSSTYVPETPFVLHLPNVMHLASDVAGVVHDASTVSSLQLAASLHPSAAVGGTPTAEAVKLIAEIEGMDRGRYAGPVGWMDATGDGEWGIALRSAEISGNTVRLFAGCGIVADSDPEAELAEAQAKFVPVRDSLVAG
jgi:menaquinone-specific isochorismate synthase